VTEAMLAEVYDTDAIVHRIGSKVMVEV